MICDGDMNEMNDKYGGPVDSEPEEDDDTPFGRNGSHWQSLSFKTLSRALRKAKPSIFTKANIRQFQVRGKRDLSIRALLDALEFGTDITGDQTIDTSLRTKRKVITHAAEVYKSKGDRYANLVIPVNYDKQGPWITKHDGDKMEVTCRFSSKHFSLTVKRGAEYYIDIKHSLMRATLRQKGNSTYAKILWTVYQQTHGAAASAAPNASLGLMGGLRRRRFASKTVPPVEPEVASKSDMPFTSPKEKRELKGKGVGTNSPRKKHKGKKFDMFGDEYDEGVAGSPKSPNSTAERSAGGSSTASSGNVSVDMAGKGKKVVKAATVNAELDFKPVAPKSK